MVKTKYLLFFCVFLHLSSCAHHRSGRYVLKGDKWVFEKSNIGFLKKGIYFGRVDNNNYSVDDSKFIWPLPGSKKVSSYFGKRRGRHHDGIDIPAITGTSIVASAAGSWQI